jgi:hypothetical protein
MSTPFTYLIGWSTLNKWYYGLKYAKECDPKDLWSTYFTSSTKVAEYRKLYGEPDVIQVRKVFCESKNACDWEHKVLVRLKAMQSEKFLNMTNSNKKFLITDEVKRKIGESNRISLNNPETKKKMSESAKKRGMSPKNIEARKAYHERSRGVPRNNDVRDKISKTLTGREFSMEHRENLRQGHMGKGRPHTQESKRKIGEANIGKQRSEEFKNDCSMQRKLSPKIECPHCGKIGENNAMKRWHFDNCKLKP